MKKILCEKYIQFFKSERRIKLRLERSLELTFVSKKLYYLNYTILKLNITYFFILLLIRNLKFQGKKDLYGVKEK